MSIPMGVQLLGGTIIPLTEVLILFGIEFSDDFDPNNSVKNNRQPIWMKSLSISANYKYMHSMMTTYPISFALKGSNHQAVCGICRTDEISQP